MSRRDFSAPMWQVVRLSPGRVEFIDVALDVDEARQIAKQEPGASVAFRVTPLARRLVQDPEF